MTRPLHLIYDATLKRLGITRHGYMCFILFVLDGGMTTKQAAEELGISEDNMSVKIATAKRYFGRDRKEQCAW